MKGEYSKISVAVVFLPVVIAVIVGSIYPGSITGFFLAQKTYTLDLEDYSFLYETNEFNDSSSSNQFDFNNTPTGRNKTFWVRIPKNSTILNASLNATGKITTIYQTLITENGLLEVRVANVTEYSGNEVISGSGKPAPNIYVINGSDGAKMWQWNLESPNNDINSIVAGNLTSNPGKEIAFTVDQLNKVVVINANKTAGSFAWEYLSPTSTSAFGIDISDLDQDGGNELVFSDEGGYVYLLNKDQTQEWNVSLGSPVTSVSIGNITSDPGEEIVAGADRVYLINSTGSVRWSKDLGYSIEDVHTGNVTDDPGNEIAVGTTSPDNKVYLLNATDLGAETKWYYQLTGYPMAVTIGDATAEPEGNEIVIGDNDQYAYALSYQGTKIWGYRSDEPIESTDVGELTAEPGVEVAAGGMQGTLYIFNFNFFPTNLSIDVGSDGDYDWNISGRLRNTTKVQGSNFEQGIQDYLDNQCTPDQGNCNVPLLFHSDYKGKLNISALNVTYRYNVSGVITKNRVDEWSRTRNIKVNESIGNESIRINFNKNPANDVEIRYVKLNSSSTRCDFNGTIYQNTSVDGENVCNISDFTLPKDGSLPGSVLFWEDVMTSDIPVFMNSSSVWYTTEPDDYRWHLNLTIWNETPNIPQTFYNVTANVTINDTEVMEEEFLNVSWGGSWCDITPSSEDSGCDSSPSYTAITCDSDTFYVCKKDTDGDETVDFFKWKQPETSPTRYVAGGSTNYKPVVENLTVSPESAVWGSNFSYSADISDGDNNPVNVTLFTRVNETGWIEREMKNVSDGQGTLTFNLTSNKSWTGTNKYRFEYFDYNSSNSSQKFHSPVNTSLQTNPQVLKHNVSFVNVTGNNSVVNRSTGSVLLGVRINDTSADGFVDKSVNTSFWVTLNGTDWDSGHQTVTNSTGHANFTFQPDGNYSVGSQWWKVGVPDDEYYKSPENSTNYSVEIHGKLSIRLTEPNPGDVVYRNETKYLEARLLDQYNKTAKVSGYNCTFWQNNSLVYNNSVTNSSGYCNYSWPANCSLSRSPHRLNVSLWGDASNLYTIENWKDSNLVEIWDKLNLTIDNPSVGEIYHKNETVWLNSTVNDTCFLCSFQNYNVSWGLNYYKKLKVNLTETAGLNRTDEPYVLNGSYLQKLGAGIEEWKINKTKVLQNGEKVPMEVRPWTNDSKVELNYSKKYVDNYTEIVFLTNLQARQSKEYWTTWNETNPQPQDKLPFIRNGGFEVGSLDGWSYNNVTYTDVYYSHDVENESLTGNYSTHLLAYDNKIFLNQSLPTALNYNNIKMVYKAWGTYDGSHYARIGVPGDYCDLGLSMTDSSKPSYWNTTSCSKTSFQNANSIFTVLEGSGFTGGYGVDVPHLLIDYICIANSTGQCVNPDSGAPLDRKIQFKENITQTHNYPWAVSEDEKVGNRRVYAKAFGQYYKSDSEWVDFPLYGWANLTRINISSDYCTNNGTDWICGVNANITGECWVHDEDTSSPIQGYNVSFFLNDTEKLGENKTIETGKGIYEFTSPSTGGKVYNLTCNITHQASVFYNATQYNSKNMSFLVRSGNTTGTLLQEPNSTNATEITRLDNYTFKINITLVNTGDGSIYSPEIIANTSLGIYTSEVACDPLGIGENCSKTVEVDVTQNSSLGENWINITAEWQNEDGTPGNATNFTKVNVENNTELNITESELRAFKPAGFEGTIGNFTVEAFGNTKLEAINFSYSGQNASTLKNWTFFDPSNIGILNKATDNVTLVNGTIPVDAKAGTYLANVTANATNSSCSPQEECWDSVLFNLTVSAPDWYRTPEEMNKSIGAKQKNGTIGQITVSNNLNINQSFNASISGNGTQWMNLSTKQVKVQNQSSEIIKVFHNRTSSIYTAGTWVSNVTIKNLNGSSPSELKTEVTLKVVNLTVDVLEPTTSSPVGPLNASDNITVRANVTKPGKIITSNTSFDVEVGGETCTIIEGPEWRDPGIYIDAGWRMICDAPQIPGNPINNSIKVTAKYEGLTSYGEETEAVAYYDVIPPTFSKVRVEPVRKGRNLSEIPIEVNITDNVAVNTTWMEIDTPYGNETLDSDDYNRTGSLYNFSFNNTQNIVGDYDITVYANDTKNTTGVSRYGGQVNNTRGWFDLYKPVNILGNMTLPTGENISANFSFYREDTTFWPYPIHQFSTNSSQGSYNWTAHKRKYDLKAELFGHEVRFDSVDTNQSAINQFGNNSNRSTNPFKFDNFPNSTCDYCDAIRVMPDEFEDPLLGFVVEENENLSSQNKTITLDYSDVSLEDIDKESNLRVLTCDSWNYTGRKCNQSLTKSDYINKEPDIGSNIITVTVSSGGTGYILAEGCYSGGDLIDCAGYYPPPEEEEEEPTGGGGGAAAPPEEEEEKPFPFELDSNIDTARLFPGEEKSYWLMITNKLDEKLGVNVSVLGALRDWIQIENQSFRLSAKESKTIGMDLKVPADQKPGTYSDLVVVEARGKQKTIPLQVVVRERGAKILSLDVELIDDSIYPDEDLQAKVGMKSLGAQEEFQVNLTYLVKNSKNKTVKTLRENVSFENAYSAIKKIPLKGENLKAGKYKLEAWVEFDKKAVKDMVSFQIIQPFWASTAGQLLLFLGLPIAIIGIVIGGMQLRKYYLKWKEEKEEEQRYLFPVDYSKIPQEAEGAYWLGRIADTKNEAWYNPKDLTTHVLVAGATGSGKSVAASVFAEEALENDVPVVVFDPTVQWTGFMRRCQDDYMLKFYGLLEMDKKKRKSYPGMIYEMDDPEREVNFKELMKPGEITVFTLDKLTPAEFDQAVRNIIDSMFEVGWEESEELKLIVVFDEVHRLLEKYGGKGGYTALEKACREFRKWGIGIIMCSQVLTDFKEAVAGNVLTDVQLNTKAMEDINKARNKYGERYAKRITRQGIGVGMMQHPQYNEGDPWFVRFRPTWHNPHKLKDEDLKKYKEFAEELERVEEKIQKLKEEGQDTFDLETSLRMARNKLKSGNFRMAEIYVNSLKERLE